MKVCSRKIDIKISNFDIPQYQLGYKLMTRWGAKKENWTSEDVNSLQLQDYININTPLLETARNIAVFW